MLFAGPAQISNEGGLICLATIKRFEAEDGMFPSHASTLLAVNAALEAAGVEFIDENGGGPGVRLRRRQRAKQSK